jgi:hypothetical protein
MQELKAEIRLRLNPKEGWEARLSWGAYVVEGRGDLCSEALADLLRNLGELAPHWLLEETAK